MRLLHLLTESIQRQRDVETIATRVISAVSDRFAAVFKRYSFEDWDEYTKTVDGHSLDSLTHIRLKAISTGGLSDEAKSFLKKWENVMVFFTPRKKQDYNGMWRRSSVEIVMDDPFVGMLSMWKDDRGWLTSQKIETSLMVDKTHTYMVHELQHAYDDFLSNGKYIRNFADYKTDWEGYMQSQHEVDARYAETMAKLRSHFSNPIHQKAGRDFLKIFTHAYHGWHLLNRDQQTRLIKRATQEFNEIPKIPNSVDITDKVKAMERTLRLKYSLKRCLLAFHHTTDMILIDNLLGDTQEAEEGAIKEILYLADTYRKTVGVTPARGFTGVKQTTLIPFIKSVGFKQNFRPNRGKRDMRYNEKFIRYSRR